MTRGVPFAVEESEAQERLDRVRQPETQHPGVELEACVQVGDHQHDMAQPLVAGDEPADVTTRHERLGIGEGGGELVAEPERIPERHDLRCGPLARGDISRHPDAGGSDPIGGRVEVVADVPPEIGQVVAFAGMDRHPPRRSVHPQADRVVGAVGGELRAENLGSEGPPLGCGRGHEPHVAQVSDHWVTLLECSLQLERSLR